ncbi:MAG: hypothetical protein ACRDTC_22365 [Pseudonocardiaceae bacterium]
MIIGKASVDIGAWVRVDESSKITYRVYPAADTVEITLGGPHGLDLFTDEAGLRLCVEAFAGALDTFVADAAALPEAGSPE